MFHGVARYVSLAAGALQDPTKWSNCNIVTQFKKGRRSKQKQKGAKITNSCALSLAGNICCVMM
jgi:hypothetical protein